jgi:hypothetical protein
MLLILHSTSRIRSRRVGEARYCATRGMYMEPTSDLLSLRPQRARTNACLDASSDPQGDGEVEGS